MIAVDTSWLVKKDFSHFMKGENDGKTHTTHRVTLLWRVSILHNFDVWDGRGEFCLWPCYRYNRTTVVLLTAFLLGDLLVFTHFRLFWWALYVCLSSWSRIYFQEAHKSVSDQGFDSRLDILLSISYINLEFHEWVWIETLYPWIPSQVLNG